MHEHADEAGAEEEEDQRVLELNEEQHTVVMASHRIVLLAHRKFYFPVLYSSYEVAVEWEAQAHLLEVLLPERLGRRDVELVGAAQLPPALGLRLREALVEVHLRAPRTPRVARVTGRPRPRARPHQPARPSSLRPPSSSVPNCNLTPQLQSSPDVELELLSSTGYTLSTLSIHSSRAWTELCDRT